MNYDINYTTTYTLDRASLCKMTVKDLNLTLTIAAIEGRSKATTKAQKIDLILRACFGYVVFTDGTIGYNPEVIDYTIAPAKTETAKTETAKTETAKTETAKTETAKAPAKPRKEPSRRALALKAHDYNWDVICVNGVYGIQHGRAHRDEFMAISKSLPAIARKLSKLIKEWQCAQYDCEGYKFMNKYLNNPIKMA